MAETPEDVYRAAAEAPAMPNDAAMAAADAHAAEPARRDPDATRALVEAWMGEELNPWQASVLAEITAQRETHRLSPS